MSLRLMLSHTPWCRWITSTGGTVPSSRRMLGAIRTIQPLSSGFGTWPPWYEMLFWPGFTSIGPTS